MLGQILEMLRILNCATGSVVKVVSLAAILVLMSCSKDGTEDLERIERLYGQEFNFELKLLSKDDEWSSFNGDGYSLHVYNSINSTNKELCSAGNMTLGKLKDMPKSYDLMSKLIDENKGICFTASEKDSLEEVLVIQENKLFLFWMTS